MTSPVASIGLSVGVDNRTTATDCSPNFITTSDAPASFAAKMMPAASVLVMRAGRRLMPTPNHTTNHGEGRAIRIGRNHTHGNSYIKRTRFGPRGPLESRNGVLCPWYFPAKDCVRFSNPPRTQIAGSSLAVVAPRLGGKLPACGRIEYRHGPDQGIWMWPNWGYSTSRSFNESATYDVATVAPTPRGTLSIVDPDAEENARSRLSPLPTVCGTARHRETSSGLSLACGRIVPSKLFATEQTT